VAPTVVRCTHVERAVRGRHLDDELAPRAEKALARDISPIDDLRSTARYRLYVAGNLLAAFLSPARTAAAPPE
jgi:CO/xanthine dehydrogenase FAD-binding subunit